MVESRTSKSLKNVQVATIFYFLNLILQFFSRSIFIKYLGSEILGLNTTAQNLLGFLNLAELGIGIAVSYNLYKPIYDKNYEQINEIISLQGWLYRKIAILVILGAAILMLFFPLIFSKADIPLWYAYGTFSVLLLSALLGYFVNYKQILLSADQKQYKITYVTETVKCVKIVLQIVAVKYLNNGYVYWMGLEALASIIVAKLLCRAVKVNYPWLQANVKIGKELRGKYFNVIVKTKQVFFHRIGSFVLSQTTPLVIYGFSSLTLVAIYGNYMLIVTAVISLMNALLNGIGAGVGNLVAQGNKENIKKVYWELTAARMYLATIFCLSFYLLADSFVTLWVGREYIIDKRSFILIIAIAFIQLTRTNDAFISAYGLYQDIWAPIAEASLNLGLSILLGYYFNLPGILTGVLISLALIVCLWKPFFLYKEGFKDNIQEYIIRYIKLLITAFFSSGISYYVLQNLMQEVGDFFQWIQKALYVVVFSCIVAFVLFYITDKYFRIFISRIVTYVHSNFKFYKKR